MKLSLLTYQLGSEFTLDELLSICAHHGIQGLECRAQLGHKHGVELDTTVEQRAEIKGKVQDSQVELAGISTSCRYEFMDAEERQEQVDLTKQFIDLAVDVGAPRVRVFGNAFPAGADRDQVVENVGQCLKQIGAHAQGTGVECNLEMHGDFYYWQYTLRAVQIADHPSIGIVYNCDPRETRWGPIRSFIDPVAPYLRHIHLHDLESNNYPYADLFRILRDLGYAQFASLECSGSEDAERVIGLYAALFKSMYASA